MLELAFLNEHKTFIFDCGIGMKPRVGSEDNIYLPDLDELIADDDIYLFLTHGHQDHVGAAPKLKKLIPHLKVFATEPTLRLTAVMCSDAIKIRKKNGHAEHYTQSELDELVHSARVVRSSDWIDLGGGFMVRFEPSGHIRGAATVLLKTPYGIFADSGDINFFDTTTVRGASLKLEDKIRWISVESTNGDVSLKDPKEIQQDLLRDVREVISRGGNVLIPAFAVGRGPDIGLFLGRELKRDRVPVYSGGLLRPVAESCCCSHWESDIPFAGRKEKARNGKEYFKLDEENIRWLTRYQDLDVRVMSGRGQVVVVPNGMLEAGYSQLFFAAWAHNPKNAIFIPGYQAEETHGRKLLGIKPGEALDITSPITGHTERIVVKAQVKTYKISGHADGDQLASWIGNMGTHDARSLDKVIMVHGDERGQTALGKKILALPNAPKDVLIGTNHQTIVL
jgi:Cft2 family RNA processing exonuclease